MIDNQELLKISVNYCFWGEFKGGEAPQSKRWVFISRRLIFRVGGCENKEIIYILELLDNAIKKIFYPLKL